MQPIIYYVGVLGKDMLKLTRRLKMEEKKLGEVFDYKDEYLIVKENKTAWEGCDRCYFFLEKITCENQKCKPFERKDKKDIHFEKIKEE